jgi:glycosyltransferase involved in cell wall biosynthesis
MTIPLLSIVIPVYNQAHLVQGLAENIRQYLTKDVEVVIQDDCSSDSSYERLRQLFLDETNVLVSRTQKNLGSVGNLLTLLERVRGRYVLFSAGDDCIVPSTLRKILERIKSSTHADIELRLCYRSRSPHSDWKLLESASLSIDEKRRFKNAAPVFANELPVNFFFKAATQPGYVWIQGLTGKTELIKKANFIEGADVDDWVLLHNLAVQAKSADVSVAVFAEVLGVLGVYPNSRGSQVTHQLVRQLQAIDRYWDSDFKREALLNALEKKVLAFRLDTSIAYAEIHASMHRSFLSPTFATSSLSLGLSPD